MAIKHKLRAHRSELSIEDTQIIENKRNRLQRLIDVFSYQADTFLPHHNSRDDDLISSFGDYDEFDHADDVVNYIEEEDTGQSHRNLKASDGSGMEDLNPEDLPILLPSSLGWKWCVSHDAKSIAAKEAQLRHAQANDAIHQIRLALGFKSALFRTQVRPANTQQTKTHAWNAVHNVDATVHEHARIYSMARDAYRMLHQAFKITPELLQLRQEDLRIETLVLGSQVTGQRNEQRSWIWSFGQTTEDDGTWMDDCKSSSSLMLI
jgi:hypothetical protein